MPTRARRGWADGRAARVVALIVCAAAVLFIALPELALGRVRHLLDTRRTDAAGRWLTVAERTSPRRGAVHFQAARLARRRGDFAEVRRRLQAALAAGWPVDDLRREQWLAQAQTGQVDAMEEHWPALFRDPGSDGPEISRAFVVAALARIRLDDAGRVLDAWEADYPADPGPHVFRGIIHAIRLEWDDAARAYTRALDLDPGDVAARRGLAEAFSKRLRFAEARDAWTAVLAAEPHDTAAAVGRCDCLVQLGEIDTARRDLAALIARAPGDVAALEVAGRLELAAGDAARAVEHLRRACERRPEDAELRYAFGRALRLAGDGAAAREHLEFREAAAAPLDRLRTLLVELPRDPWNADLRTEIGELTYRWKSREEGLQWIRRALDVDPEHPAARALLESHRSDGHTTPPGGSSEAVPERPRP